MRFRAIAGFSALGLAFVLTARTFAQDCRCVATFSAEGRAKEIRCDGFDTATHDACRCQRATINGQQGCKAASAVTAAEPAAPEDYSVERPEQPHIDTALPALR